MKISRRDLIKTSAALTVLGAVGGVSLAEENPLPSWNKGPAREAILSFVKATTEKSSPNYVEPKDRVATFDQDGTLWTEHPLYTQAMFAFARLGQMAPQHPEWKETEPLSRCSPAIKKAWQSSRRKTGWKSSAPRTPG